MVLGFTRGEAGFMLPDVWYGVTCESLQLLISPENSCKVLTEAQVAVPDVPAGGRLESLQLLMGSGVQGLSHSRAGCKLLGV